MDGRHMRAARRAGIYDFRHQHGAGMMGHRYAVCLISNADAFSPPGASQLAAEIIYAGALSFRACR